MSQSPEDSDAPPLIRIPLEPTIDDLNVSVTIPSEYETLENAVIYSLNSTNENSTETLLKLVGVLDSEVATNTGLLAVQKTIVDLHNNYRRLETATNMLEMKWSDEAAQQAQRWADNCVWGHDEFDDRRANSKGTIR